MDSCSKPIPIPEGLLLCHDPFALYNHIKITALFDDGSATGELTIRPDSLNPYGIVHGGCLTTLADTVGGWGVYAATKRPCVTASYTQNFLRPAKGNCDQKIFCRAVPEKIGNKLCVYRLIITNESGTELSTGLFTFFLVETPISNPVSTPSEHA